MGLTRNLALVKRVDFIFALRVKPQSYSSKTEKVENVSERQAIFMKRKI